MFCGGEEVFIVGMNLTKAVLLRASEVEGIRGTKENFLPGVCRSFDISKIDE